LTTDGDKVPERAIGALGDILRIASESPDAREAGATAGKSLKIISDTIHTVLLPLAVVNYGVQKFQTYVSQRFAPELQSALAGTPAENITEPSPMIAGPTLSALVYAHEENDIRELFIQLLASSMDRDRKRAAHPAFVEIIKGLDPGEVAILRSVLRIGELPVVELYTGPPSGSYRLLERDVTPLLNDQKTAPEEEPLMGAYLHNWERLGLIEIDYVRSFSDKSQYDYVESRPEYQRALARLPAELREMEEKRGDGSSVLFDQDAFLNSKPYIEKGVINVTPWGKQFASAVGVTSETED